MALPTESDASLRTWTEEDVLAWLEARAVSAKLHRDLSDVHTVAQAASVTGVPEEHVGKTVLFMHEDEPIAVIARGTGKVDDKALAAFIQGRRKALRIAKPDEVLEHTGYPVGAVPPVAHRHPIRLLMDEQVLDADEVVFGGGGVRSLLSIDPRVVRDAMGAEVGSFVKSA